MPVEEQKKSHPKGQGYYVSREIGKAISDYSMLQEGDRIIVAVSGGKDSVALINMMKYRQTFVPISFELLAVYVDSGASGSTGDAIADYCQGIGVPCHIERIDAPVDKTGEDNECYACSRGRRRALFELAHRLGFNKIALGHHMDDIAETILLNCFYRGEISTMCPKKELFNGRVTIIRPMAYVSEQDVRLLVAEEGFPVFDQEEKCLRNDTSKRMLMKKMLAELSQHNPNAKRNVIRSLENIRKDYLP